jgi:hypothetical protein
MGDLNPDVSLFNVYSLNGIEGVGAMLPSGVVVMEFISGSQLAMKIFDDAEDFSSTFPAEMIRWVGRCEKCPVKCTEIGCPEPMVIRVFDLIRTEDVTGVSGTGKDDRNIVACGVVLPSGKVVMQWITRGMYSVNYYVGGITELEKLHGHDGRSRVQFRKRTVFLYRRESAA